jgi:hypothetical protein
MKQLRGRFLPLLAICMFIVLIAGALFIINFKKNNSAYLQNTTINIQDIPRCSSTPNFDPGPHTMSRVIDLDPSIPIESKPSFVIKRANGNYEMIYYSVEEQIVKYFEALKEKYCLVVSSPPTCLMGHYPGEPPGREPCIVPTQN